jgi:hypothetical protein
VERPGTGAFQFAGAVDLLQEPAGEPEPPQEDHALDKKVVDRRKVPTIRRREEQVAPFFVQIRPTGFNSLPDQAGHFENAAA